MGKKGFTVVFIILCLLGLNIVSAQEVDNSTLEKTDDSVLEISVDNQSTLNAEASVKTHIDVESNTDFDVIGDYFKVKLSDENNKAISNTQLTFSLNGATYKSTTDNNGIASLQLRVNDGTYKVVTKFAGNSKYKSSSLTSIITMTNTRVVDSGRSNSEIQNIINNAKTNNVILFNGNSYSDINLVVTKSLTLLSNVNTVLKSSSGPVITVSGKSASLTKIKGFKIQGSGDGIVVKNSDYVTIVGNEITTKSNAIVVDGAKYLNITKNNLVGNSKNGIVLANGESIYINNNKITKNGEDGITIAKSSNVYIYENMITENTGNGIYTSTRINGINYGEAPKNLYITQNTINKNSKDGIYIYRAGDNVKIASNEISSNNGNGIQLSKIGNNVIQSNVVYDNRGNGIKFKDDYVKPKNQDISYNVLYFNHDKDVEAKDTYYQENGERLSIGDNWYGDLGFVCPKIKTNNLKFTVKQVGKNQFQAVFTDSKGNIASLLPDRTLTYQTNNGQIVSLTVKGGIATFNVDANANDIVKSTVDRSQRDNTYNAQIKNTVPAVNGKSPTYSYPDIPKYQLYDDIGKGMGDGTGEGSGGNTNKGNGKSPNESSDFTGNSTTSQNMNPSNNGANQINDASQNLDSSTTSQASASDASSGQSSNAGDSVVKQILLDEDEIVKISGISLIILLILLTIGFYYKDDIQEMKSKL